MNPLHIILAISLAANIAFGWAYLGQRDAATTSAVHEQHAVGVALGCSQAVEALDEQAEKRRAAAAPKIAAARVQAKAADKRADVILATPPAVPGNDCSSAQARVDEWWQRKAKP